MVRVYAFLGAQHDCHGNTTRGMQITFCVTSKHGFSNFSFSTFNWQCAQQRGQLVVVGFPYAAQAALPTSNVTARKDLMLTTCVAHLWEGADHAPG